MRKRTISVALIVVATLATALAAGVWANRGHVSGHAAKLEKLADALKGRATPGRLDKMEKGREASREITNGPSQELYSDMAYPAKAIAFQQAQASQRADERVRGHGFRSPKRWDSIGPDTLNVDTLGTQTYGVPTQWSGRVTAMAISPRCSDESCRIYIGAAGGGVWRTNNALSRHPHWKQISEREIPTTAIGSLLIDPTDRTGRTIYVGTGEPNGSSDSEAGLGLYKSTDGGEHWSLVPGSVAVAKDRGIGAIAVDPRNPNHVIIGTAVARHGFSSNSGGRYTPPGAPPVGVYETRNGGASFAATLLRPSDPVDPASANGGDFFRGGVTKIGYDPNNASRLFVAMFGYGLFRSSDNGTTYETIFQDNVSDEDLFSIRYEFATADLGAKTRIYLGAGDNEVADDNGNIVDGAKLYRTDDAGTPAAALIAANNSGWTKLTSNVDGTPTYATLDFCQAQCSYDMFVESPAGHPDWVAIGGSMFYGELPPYGGPDRSNGRAVQLSTDSGIHWNDMTGDVQRPGRGLRFHAEDMHPDQHVLGFVPDNPAIMFVGSDGGMIRTSGRFANDSASCDSRGLTGVDLADCRAWLSRIPSQLKTMNAGLNTLQFQQLSVNRNNPYNDLLGGTQDNGTLAYFGSPTWFLGMTGDGGDSGIDPVDGRIRFHTYTNDFVDVNFHGNRPETWDWIGDPIFLAQVVDGEQGAFYAPMTQDPVRGGQIFAGLEHVYRTQDSGGDPAFLDAHCNTTGQFGTSDKLFTGECGDWVQASPNLANGPYGSKGGSYVIAIERAMDAHTMWVGTRRGRIFISRNADAPADSVTYTRIDTDAQPKRLPSGISVDPTNPLHAFITYSGYNAYAVAAGTAPGHVFEVTVDPTTLVATWKLVDYNLGDQPILDVVYDQPTGDVYVSTDWGVNRLIAGTTAWVPAAAGLPPVATYGLTPVRGRHGERLIYAATHGRGAYRLELPKAK